MHLPTILITGKQWNPVEEILCPERQSRESVKMHTIRSLTSGMTRRQIRSVTKDETRAQIEHHREMGMKLGKFSCVYDMKEFCDCLLSAVNARNPFPTGYKPKINATEELDHTLALRYMQLIGILHWAVEIGQTDIFLETSLLSQYQANP
jgi:hypothetical protein